MQMRFRRRFGRHLGRQLLHAQENEITESVIYRHLSRSVPNERNRRILEQIANEESRHAEIWKRYTSQNIKPRRHRVFFYRFIARLLGFTFAVKLMEKGEEKAQINYRNLKEEIPQAAEIEKEEKEHEQKLLGLLDEEKLKYVGSMVLGVNDALVELTGALAGLTLALQNGSLIALSGLITGIAASFSMGASEYLSTKAEGGSKDPVKASIYTGLMYIVTVIILIAPYFFFANIYFALLITLTNAVAIIFLFTFYISVAQDLPFKKRFLEMVGISLGVSLLTFIIGFIVRQFIQLDI